MGKTLNDIRVYDSGSSPLSSGHNTVVNNGINFRVYSDITYDGEPATYSGNVARISSSSSDWFNGENPVFDTNPAVTFSLSKSGTHSSKFEVQWLSTSPYKFNITSSYDATDINPNATGNEFAGTVTVTASGYSSTKTFTLDVYLKYEGVITFTRETSFTSGSATMSYRVNNGSWVSMGSSFTVNAADDVDIRGVFSADTGWEDVSFTVKYSNKESGGSWTVRSTNSSIGTSSTLYIYNIHNSTGYNSSNSHKITFEANGGHPSI